MGFETVIYNTLPSGIQSLGLSLLGFYINKNRYSEQFYTELENFKITKSLDRNCLHDVHCERFERLLFNIKSRERSAARLKFLYGDISPSFGLDDLFQLPIVSKDELRNCLAKIPFHKNEGSELKQIHTSGTTGAGFVFPRPAVFESRQWAVWWRFRENHNINMNDVCGYFGGRSIVPSNETKKFYRYNAASRQVMFSGYHLSEQNLESYIEGINRYGAKWLHGYPSIISDFARLLEKKGLESSIEIDIVSTGAESLLSYQREIIRRVLNCQIIEHYGMAEGTANISQELDGVMKVDEDYSIVDLVKDDRSNNSYRIIGSSLDNYVLPMFRYDANDLCSFSDNLNDIESWRSVESIDGRVEDSLVLIDGSRVGRLDHIFKDLVFVNKAQLVQSEIGKCSVYVVLDGDLLSSHINEIKGSFYEFVGDRLTITVEKLSNINKTKSGKHRFVVSRL
jgi:phenylacetate-CoA ligase